MPEQIKKEKIYIYYIYIYMIQLSYKEKSSKVQREVIKGWTAPLKSEMQRW